MIVRAAVRPALLLVLLLLSMPLAAAPVLHGDPLAGRDKADTERCLECHGSAGEGQGYSNGSDGKFAKLDGQYPEYIVKQIADFRSGRRQHEFMKMMAASVSDADLADIAAYFGAAQAMAATTPAAAGPGATPASAQPAAYADAARLVASGDAARGVVACASCHGADGRGLAAAVGPVIAGQGRRYLEQQLQDWRSGFRRNSAGSIMNQQATRLTDADITALAGYLSQLSPTPQPSQTPAAP